MNHKHIKKIIVTLLIVVLAELTFLANNNSSNQIILINKTGFSPKNISINQGEIVIFKNVDKVAHWPASDNHPTHEKYPDFDIKNPLMPKETWSFKFNRSGEFSFHDHLSPKFSGLIKVKGNKINNLPNEKSKIVQKVNHIYENEGSLKAWNYFTSSYPDVESFSHDIAHYIGTLIYKEYGINGVKFCDNSYGLGCYHGFIEELIHTEGVSRIDDLTLKCNDLGTSKTMTCYHGLGHGLLTHYKYNLYNSLTACDNFSPKEYTENCYGGVFMENSPYAVQNERGMNELWPCTEVSEKYKKSCYLNVQDILFTKVEPNNYKEAFSICMNSKEYVKECIKSIGGYIWQKSRNNLELIKKNCSETHQEYKYECIISAGEAFMTYKGNHAQALSVLCSDMPSSWESQCIKRIDLQYKINKN